MGKKKDPDEKKKKKLVVIIPRKMSQEMKYVQGPCDDVTRVRGNKAGKGRRYLPVGHPSRCH